MENSKIHEGLDKKEIRDFLALALLKTYAKEGILRKGKFPYDPDGMAAAVREMEEEIIWLQKKLIFVKERAAICKIIKSSGWDDFDVSEYTDRLVEYDNCMNFIGTGEEYNEFVRKCELGAKKQ